MGDNKIDGLRSRFLCSTDEIALVLAIFRVKDNHEFASTNGGNSGVNR
jgi:hypothetical protein